MAKVIEETGIPFTVHDLRRTFITIAESLDIPAYALKRLLNHKMASDVTAGYIIIDVERLRKPMQMITDHILLQIGLKKSPMHASIHPPKGYFSEKAEIRNGQLVVTYKDKQGKTNRIFFSVHDKKYILAIHPSRRRKKRASSGRTAS